MPLLDTELAQTGVVNAEEEKENEERRHDADLSLVRALDIDYALCIANQELQGRKNNLVDRLEKWFMDALGRPFNDITVPTDFRKDDKPSDIRRLFLETLTVVRDAALGAIGTDLLGDVCESKVKSILERVAANKAEVLANLGEILSRSGKTDVIEGDRLLEEDFVDGNVYSLKINGKKVVGLCVGHVKGDGYFFGRDRYRYSSQSGAPIFEFDGKLVGDHHQIGKKYDRQEAEYDSVEVFCGYTRAGETVMHEVGRTPIGV